MHFDGCFKRIGSANVESVAALLEKLSEPSWQQDEDDALSDGAQIINLVWDDELRHDQPMKQPALEVFATPLRPILAVTADHFDTTPEGRALSEKYGTGYFVRARFLRVPAGQGYEKAADTVFSERHSHRVHVPIISSKNVRFSVGDETLCLPAGEIYEIDNLQQRRIDNDGDQASVHLILDYVLNRQPDA